MATIPLFCQIWRLLKSKQRQTPIKNFQKVQIWEWKHQEKMSYLICFVRYPIIIENAGKAVKAQLFNLRCLTLAFTFTFQMENFRIALWNQSCRAQFRLSFSDRYIWLRLASGLSHLSTANGNICNFDSL